MKGKHLIRRYFIAGLLVWLPIWVTVFVIRFIIDLLDSTFALLPQSYQPDQLFGYHIPGLGFVFTLLIVFLTGLLVTNFVGRHLITWWERIMSRIPLVRSIYTAVKQVTDAFIQPKGRAFRKVVLIEYPRKGTWSLAFITSSNFKGVPMENNDNKLAVFVPTTPNPTSGFLLLVDKKDTVDLNITIEEALRMILSLGVVTPFAKTPNSV